MKTLQGGILMKLTILGTGNAAVCECYNTCFALTNEAGETFLTDCGGGNRILKVLKDAGIPLNRIHDIFLTHEHIDHLLGLIWLIRMIGTEMNKGTYEGDCRIYCHEDLKSVIETICKMTIQQKVTKHLGQQIQLIAVEDGESRQILDSQVTFFDIGSTKAKQYGFRMVLPEGQVLTCLGDEPYNPLNEKYVVGCDWLMHEAFCLYSEADRFKPYEKHHSTVKEACETAEAMNIPHLILYHTEEKNLARRKELYGAEGRQYYHGDLQVPDDGEVLWI